VRESLSIGAERGGATIRGDARMRDLEAVTLVATWLHSRLESSHRALGLGEPSSKLDLERSELELYVCDPGKDAARQQRLLHSGSARRGS